MLTEEFIIETYCLVDEAIKLLLGSNKLRQRGFSPNLTDAELITIELVAETLGLDTEKGMWQYCRQNWISFFPTIASRSSFAKQSANLWRIKQLMHQL